MGCETPPAGRRGVVIGIAGETTLAYRWARRLRDAGAELAITWANDRTRPLAKPLGEDLQANVAMPLDVEQPGAVESLFETIHARWRRLDFVLHCIALAPSEPTSQACGCIARRFPACHGHVLLRVRAHGAPCRAAHG